MKEQKSIKLNIMMNAILTMSSFVFPLITFPYVSRILHASGTGKVQLAMSLVSYFLLISQLGIPIYGIRICAKVRDDRSALSKTVQELFIIETITTVLSYIAFYLIVFNVSRLQTEKNLYVVVSVTIFFNLIGMEWLYKAIEQYTYITIRSIICKIISLIAMFMLINKESDYVVYGGISVLASSVSYIFNFFNAHKYINFIPTEKLELGQHVKPICIFFAMSCATTVYTNLDTVMLGFMTTDTDVGYYGAAIKIKSILVSVVTSLSTVLLPRASYYIQNDNLTEFRRIVKTALNLVFVITIPLTLYFMLFAKYGIFFLSGEGYEGAIAPMTILMPTLILIGTSNLFGVQILVPMGKEKIVLYSTIIGAIINILINAVLIPKISSCGAAIGTLIAEFVVLLFQYFYIKTDIADLLHKLNYKAFFISNFVAIILSIWTWKLTLNSFFILTISASCYFGSYFILLLLFKDSIAIEIVTIIKRIFRIKSTRI